MLKEDQQMNLNLKMNGTKPTMKVLKPMLGLYLVFLMEFAQMSFSRLQIANIQRKHEIYFMSLMKVRLL